MASKSNLQSSELSKSLETEGHGMEPELRAKILQERFDKNRAKIQSCVSNLQILAASRNECVNTESHKSENCLSLRMKNPICKVGRIIEGLGDKHAYNLEETLSAAAVKLPRVEKIPPYTTWTFSNRNRMMADFPSVIKKKCIYYNENSREPLICSEGEEEAGETVAEEPKIPEKECHTDTREVSQGRAGHISAMMIGLFGDDPLEIQENSDEIMEKDQPTEKCNFNNPVEDGHNDVGFMDESLNEALDTFDVLFCRHCMRFDCGRHSRSANVIYPRERQPFYPEEEDPKPCGDHCYLMDLAKSSAVEETEKLSSWKHLEKDLYQKGIEMYGRNSCYIARNLLDGFKTCKEVANYMNGDGAVVPHSPEGKLDEDHTEQFLYDSSRTIQRKSTSRSRKSSWRSGSHPSRRKILNGKDELYKHFTPCGCQDLCGKGCPCIENGTCEKSCGCPKSCKNRFKGCSCAKSQCRSKRCPCVAASRECDPDVCRNCWVSCGDGTLGAPSRGPSGQCGNMNMLLGKHQRILIAQSDVHGWGAFLKNPVQKNDFIGEYTGELISHEEADRRGKDYDLKNKSYLFDLNDEFVIDACRTGNKLRFINHSSEPNCSAKVMSVSGDHHIGFYAKRNIKAGEELSYDYHYDANQAEWSQTKKTQPEPSA